METFTTTIQSIPKEVDHNEYNLSEIETELFYKSLHADLDSLEQQPKAQTIAYILNYSRGL